MKSEGLDLGQINWNLVLPRLGVDDKYLTKTQGPCPMCGGNTRFRFDNKEDHGTWYCNRCGAGNGVTLVAKVNGWSNAEAFKAILNESTVVPLRPYIVRARKEPTRDELRSKLQRIWDEALPIVPGDPVWRYLHARIPGLGPLPAPSELRHHPALEYFEPYKDAKGRNRSRSCGKFHAMLAKIRNKDGRPVNLHRTYLSEDGQKARILRTGSTDEYLKVKKMERGVEKYTGGAVHLYAPDGTGRLGVGEGIETMLAVRAGYKNRLPVWPCLNEGGVRKFVIPDWVTELHIFADNDLPDEKGKRVGQEAAAALLRRAVKEGFVLGARRTGARRVFLHIPKEEGTDFLDQWVAMQGLRAA
ncbi:MAG: DUF7146 domain-containing protein [Pseudomonadota bacterium]|jgi:putative DNA primase/helicase